MDKLKALTSESVLIDHNLMNLFVVIIQEVLQVDLRGVIGVRAENHAAVLPVKREVGHLGKVNNI